jgi:DNA-binding transcriptional regulator YhcF (GntR family)
MGFIEINTKWITPIYEQIKESIIRAIEQGLLKKGDKVPSIHNICREFGISPGTVLKAYDDLCRIGILVSKKGKGYYISHTRVVKKLNIFMLFDRINTYKEMLYDSFIQHIGPNASVQVFFHHYDDVRFNSLIRDNLGKFNYYVIMPHFNHDVSEVLMKIPENKLLIIDKEVPRLKGRYAGICQNFKEDIYEALKSGLEQISNYRQIIFARSPSKFQFIPDGSVRGFEQFIADHQLNGRVIPNIREHASKPGELYIVFPDNDLIYLIKKAKENNWKIGQDIGIIAFDDSPMKEVLAEGISVVSTDFEAMGKTAAGLILSEKKEKLYNPFRLILRRSL